jgi:serine/threonine protein kinase
MENLPNRHEKQRVGKYILGNKLGEGGFGIVRQARHEETGQQVAIKIMDKAQIQLLQMTPQIKREITLLTMLKHPNIVNGYEILNSKTKLYMVMEFVEGGDLHSLLSVRHRLREDEAKRIFTGLMDCLVYCHGQGIHHRDLKLENILISSEGTAKVCDFGLASIRALSGNTSQLCNTIVGTEDFASPEIIQQIPYNAEKADMWSAGIILFTILAGFCPFRGSDTQNLFANIQACRYSFPDRFPNGAKDIVSSLLVKNPAARPAAVNVRAAHWLSAEPDDSGHTDSPRHIQATENLLEPSANWELEDEDETSRSNGSSVGLNGCAASGLTKLVLQNPALALAAQTIHDFHRLYGLIRNANIVKDRRWRLKVYPNVFVGSEMVTWLSQNFQLSREEAVQLGEKMLVSDVFHHVCRDHSFKDDYLFYRFSADEPDDSRVLNLRRLWPETLAAREPLVVSQTLLLSLLALLKIHQILVPAGAVGEVDLAGLRQDEAFVAFRIATAELQAVQLEELQSSSAGIAFLVNLFHILVVHERIHCEHASFRRHSRVRSKLQYNVGGYRLGLDDIESLLQTEDYDKEQHAKRESGSLISASMSIAAHAFARLVRVTGELERLGSFLELNHADLKAVPLVLSSACSADPPIRVFNENEVDEHHLLSRTAHFLRQKVLIDVDQCKVGFPNVMRIYRERYAEQGTRGFLVSAIALFAEFRSVTESDTICESLEALLRSELNPQIYFLYEDLRFAPVIELGACDVAESTDDIRCNICTASGG